MSNETVEDGVLYEDQVRPQEGALGMTVRELLIVAVWLVAFVISFFPLYSSGDQSIWQTGLHWVLAIGVPTIAVFLLVLRRFSPEGIRRVGSLGIDQVASVAFSVSAVVWGQLVWDLATASVDGGLFSFAWVPLVEFIAALCLVILTVLAPAIPGLREDFHGRLETLAHRNANPVRPVLRVARTESSQKSETIAPLVAPEEPADEASAEDLFALDATDESAEDDAANAAWDDDETHPATHVAAVVGSSEAEEEPAAADADSDVLNLEDLAPYEDAEHPADHSRPFWILAPSPRSVNDARGRELFEIGPTAWALVIEDRGGAYVIRHDDGRIGYLHEIDDLTKG
jgi:hypothetical protein